ncbi:MAG: hypothetical protein L6Q97_23650, partial [Thermoanaerobaculia bacterium]|nr:hypothetical protein [Thermoanaerobaculia bacterium]
EFKLAHLAGAGLSMEALTASKLGGALNDFTTQMVSNNGDFSKYNISSTLFELNPFANPFVSMAFQGYGSEIFSFKGLEYQGIGRQGFSLKTTFQKGSVNTIGNFLGDYPAAKLEPFRLGPTFNFMGSHILNSPGNLGANFINDKYFDDK